MQEVNAEHSTQLALSTLAAQAQMLSENIAMNMLQLGRVFTEAKQIIPHGQFGTWVQSNTGLSERYAQQFMQAYSRYGENQSYARLGKSKLIRLLSLPEGEEERFIEEHDVAAMSTREIDEAVKAERAKWQKVVHEAEDARRAAEQQVIDLTHREPEIPDDVFTSIQAKDATIAQQREAMGQMADQSRQLMDEAVSLRSENSTLRQENQEQDAMLKELQDGLDRAQRELLDARSELARGNADRVPADQLTLEAFASAVRQFIGTVARMPHMRASFSTMPYSEKREYDALLATVEHWASDSRTALDSVAGEGSVA